jgi:hypothetical protein
MGSITRNHLPDYDVHTEFLILPHIVSVKCLQDSSANRHDEAFHARFPYMKFRMPDTLFGRVLSNRDKKKI